eukprot:8924606-Pyramimonas_sp.AAC.1
MPSSLDAAKPSRCSSSTFFLCAPGPHRGHRGRKCCRPRYGVLTSCRRHMTLALILGPRDRSDLIDRGYPIAQIAR